MGPLHRSMMLVITGAKASSADKSRITVTLSPRLPLVLLLLLQVLSVIAAAAAGAGVADK